MIKKLVMFCVFKNIIEPEDPQKTGDFVCETFSEPKDTSLVKGCRLSLICGLQ